MANNLNILACNLPRSLVFTKYDSGKPKTPMFAIHLSHPVKLQKQKNPSPFSPLQTEDSSLHACPLLHFFSHLQPPSAFSLSASCLTVVRGLFGRLPCQHFLVLPQVSPPHLAAVHCMQVCRCIDVITSFAMVLSHVNFEVCSFHYELSNLCHF